MPFSLFAAQRASAPADSAPAAAQSAPGHLGFLDGLRGLAALYVLCHHAYLALLYAPNSHSSKLASLILKGMKPFAFGHYAVDLFIVLSGYCLMLPVLRSGGLRGGLKAYIGRRARRILPPYYAALVGALLLLAVLHSLGEPSPLPTRGDLLSHVLLIHNLFNGWAHGIDAPMWSVATEWQIYFCFPLILIPLWKKGGMALTVAAAFALGLSLHFFAPGGLLFAAPWFLGLFALGMAGAAINFPSAPAQNGLLKKIPWGLSALALVGALVVVGIVMQGWFVQHPWLIDPIFGLAAMCLIVFCVQANQAAAPSPAVLKLCNSRGALLLGSFSYSLYLIHDPLLDAALFLMNRMHLSPLLRLVCMFGLCLPLIVGVAYLFYLRFERPFLSTQSRAVAQSNRLPEISLTKQNAG